MRDNPHKYYISKPPDGSLGNGIKIITFDDFYTIPQNAVVSEYISRPLCIDGFKFDFRIYVLVTSFSPLRAYVNKEGLARFATQSYSSGGTNVYANLTNATLNKHGENWRSEFKWKLSDLLGELKIRLHIEPDFIMNKICHTVRKTLAIIQHSMIPAKKFSLSDPFFELYGFDLILDRDFNMSLLEINTFPSLGTDEEVDFQVKSALISQTLSLVGIPNISLEELKEEERKFTNEITSSLNAGKKFVDIFNEYQTKIQNDEDERNRLSGNGFIRVFPVPPEYHLSQEEYNEVEYLKTLLVNPIYHLDTESQLKQRNNILFHPKRLAKLLSEQQSKEILLEYLKQIQKELRNGDLSQRGIIRLQAFLSAQGYTTNGAESTISPFLKEFISNLNKSLHLTPENSIPGKTKDIILNSGEKFLSTFFSKCNLGNIERADSLFL